MKIIAVLLPEIIVKIPDVMTNPPSGNRYEQMKSTLIERFSLSERVKLDRVLGYSEMGNSEAEFYHRLVILANKYMD